MADFTVRQFGPRAGQRGKIVNIEIQKPSHNKAILVDDAGKNLVEFEVTEAGAFNVKGTGITSLVASVPTHKLKDRGLDKNWRIDEGFFYVRPSSKHPDESEIRLPIMAKPGLYTPQEFVPETMGQEEMLFALALGIAQHKPVLSIGPTGTAKTTTKRWLAKTLNYNFVLCPISRGTESVHLVGEYLPTGEPQVPFDWTDGPVTQATRLSSDHPTILCFDEINRIGNIAEFARIYSLLDDSKVLELKEKRNEGQIEVIRPGELYIFATANPTDDEGADYIGVTELDPALSSRFPYQPEVAYPPKEMEA